MIAVLIAAVSGNRKSISFRQSEFSKSELGNSILRYKIVSFYFVTACPCGSELRLLFHVEHCKINTVKILSFNVMRTHSPLKPKFMTPAWHHVTSTTYENSNHMRIQFKLWSSPHWTEAHL